MPGKRSQQTPRKPRADAQRNRERILEIARREFTRSGANVSPDDVAKQAGVGAGTLYRHFPTREALLEAVHRSEQANSQIPTRFLLLIRLTQQAPMGSVEACPDRRFPKRCGNFKATSPPKKPANSTSGPVAGPMASSARDADIGERTNW